MGGEDFLAPMEPASQRLSNADFRKLMMTPRGGSGAAPATPAHGEITPGGGAMSGGSGASTTARRVDKVKAEERRKKKTYYAKLKKDEDDKMAELAAKYRDRAKERRDGVDGPNVPTEDTTSAYRAVAPNAHGVHDAAERRKQMIHESKYLGGDMEHTHLVKGLDFALLQKVRAEIVAREVIEAEEEEETNIREASDKADEKSDKKESDEKDEDDGGITECRTTMGKNIMRQMFNAEGPKCNELFMPGRMAYVMDLEEDGETDIPTTSIRSKKDVVNSNQKSTISTNDIVINKLTQILSYLRAGNRTKRKKKDKIEDLLAAEEEVIKNNPAVKGKDAEVPIYDDLEDYKPSRKEDKRRDRDRERDRDRDRDRGRDKDRDRDRGRDKDRDRRDRERDRDRDREDRRRDKYRDERDRDERPSKKLPSQSYFDKPAEEPQEKQSRGFSNEDKVRHSHFGVELNILCISGDDQGSNEERGGERETNCRQEAGRNDEGFRP